MPTRMKRGGGIPTYLYNMAIKGERKKERKFSYHDSRYRKCMGSGGDTRFLFRSGQKKMETEKMSRARKSKKGPGFYDPIRVRECTISRKIPKCPKSNKEPISSRFFRGNTGYMCFSKPSRDTRLQKSKKPPFLCTSFSPSPEAKARRRLHF